MSIAAVNTSRQAWRHGRAILLQHVEHCRTGTSSSRALSSAAAAADDGDSRLGALRKKLREEEETAATGVKLHDFSFSGNVSYGTAVPRRTRDKSGKVRRVRVCGYLLLLLSLLLQQLNQLQHSVQVRIVAVGAPLRGLSLLSHVRFASGVDVLLRRESRRVTSHRPAFTVTSTADLFSPLDTHSGTRINEVGTNERK